MKLYAHTFFAVFALAATGLALTGCQQVPASTAAAPVATPAPAPAPTTTTESTSTSQTTEVKSDPANPDAPAQKTTTSESTTTKNKQ